MEHDHGHPDMQRRGVRRFAYTNVDRDGTLIFERGYLVEASQLVPLPGVEVALRKVKAHGIPIVMVTNQSAIGRGLVDERGLARIHHRVQFLLGIDAVYVCPHLPDAGCACRKPGPALVRQPVCENGLDPRRTVMIGDHLGDCIAARDAGIEGILVRSGHGSAQSEKARREGFRVVADLPEAVDIFLARVRQ